MEKSVQTGTAKGRSGAVIVVTGDRAIKIGVNLRRQYIACGELYPVTPHVLDHLYVGDNAEAELYTMEKLEEPFCGSNSWDPVAVLSKMRDLLHTVWSREAKRNAWHEEWLDDLVNFCQHKGFAIRMLTQQLGMHEWMSGVPYVIHGDPTLSNAMLRKSTVDGYTDTIVICDPISPDGKIPPHYTVDIGKLLQSAIGWESHILDLPTPTADAVRAALGDSDFESGSVVAKQAWFWCFVHLLRILPYVTPFGPDFMWCHERARAIYKDLKEDKVGQCYLPLI